MTRPDNGSLGPVFDHVANAARTSPRPSASTAQSSPRWAPSRATRTPSSWSGTTGTSGNRRRAPRARGLHIGFRAPSREAVNAFWQAGVDAGYRDDGAPGPRPAYRPDYYGGFLLDPDGNSAEAVHTKRDYPVPDGRIDHLDRVRDPGASRRFYMTIAPHAGWARHRRARPRPDDRRGLQLLADSRRAAAHGARPYRVPGAGRRDRARVPRRRARRGLRGPRRPRRAHRLPPGLLRRVRPGRTGTTSSSRPSSRSTGPSA